jgi:hypothetical protein
MTTEHENLSSAASASVAPGAVRGAAPGNNLEGDS